jgi:hypothetical protein
MRRISDRLSRGHGESSGNDVVGGRFGIQGIDVKGRKGVVKMIFKEGLSWNPRRSIPLVGTFLFAITVGAVFATSSLMLVKPASAATSRGGHRIQH